jgi:acyl-coenzyme A thioesterase PaaI-like protein
MDVSQLPFNKLIGLESAAKESGFQVSLPDNPQYTNHLGTVHASAMLAVAEAGSGAFLSQQFAGHSGFVPVVRRLEAKFRKPGSGQISARCVVSPEEVAHWTDELTARGRVSVSIPVEVVDTAGSVVTSALGRAVYFPCSRVRGAFMPRVPFLEKISGLGAESEPEVLLGRFLLLQGE